MLERMAESIRTNLVELESALGKYQKDPKRYKPQLDNILINTAAIQTAARIIVRRIGELKT